MQLNGKTVCLEKAVTLQEYLASCGYDTAKIAVERNGKIVPRKCYVEQFLSEADVLEVVSFVGGG